MKKLFMQNVPCLLTVDIARLPGVLITFRWTLNRPADPSDSQLPHRHAAGAQEELLQAGDGGLRHRDHPDHHLPGGGAGGRHLVRAVSHGGQRGDDQAKGALPPQDGDDDGQPGCDGGSAGHHLHGAADLPPPHPRSED